MENTEEFEKQQFLEGRGFRAHRDVAQAVLKEGRMYTLDEAKGEINGYLEKKIGERSDEEWQ